jgi:hypothetical protein
MELRVRENPGGTYHAVVVRCRAGSSSTTATKPARSSPATPRRVVVVDLHPPDLHRLHRALGPGDRDGVPPTTRAVAVSLRGAAGPVRRIFEIVTYRFDRVRALTSLDPLDPAHRFTLQTAVLGAQLLGLAGPTAVAGACSGVGECLDMTATASRLLDDSRRTGVGRTRSRRSAGCSPLGCPLDVWCGSLSVCVPSFAVSRRGSRGDCPVH